MKVELSTGNRIVDEISRMNIGSARANWYKTIRKPSGPHLLAIAILSDILYWYTWIEVRDEGTGYVIGYKKKFKDTDYLQRNYEQISKYYGVSEKVARDTVVFLEQLGLVRRHFKTVQTQLRKIPNVMFLEVVPSKVWEYTYSVESEEIDEVSSDADDSMPTQSDSTTPTARDRIPLSNDRGTSSKVIEENPTVSWYTNTSNTTFKTTAVTTHTQENEKTKKQKETQNLNSWCVRESQPLSGQDDSVPADESCDYTMPSEPGYDNASPPEPDEPAESTDSESLSVPTPKDDYARIIFGIWERAGLPLPKSGFSMFLQRDFRLALGELRGQGLRSDDVIRACKNYASVIELKRQGRTWWTAELPISSFTKPKTIGYFLPDYFDPDAFRKSDVRNKPASARNLDDKIGLEEN